MEWGYPPLFFILSIITYLSIGFRSILRPTIAASTAGGLAISDGSICLGVSRYSDYALVHMPIGSSLRDLKLLLRLDHFTNNTDKQPTVQITSHKVLQSETIVCSSASLLNASLSYASLSSTSLCTDTVSKKILSHISLSHILSKDDIHV